MKMLSSRQTTQPFHEWTAEFQTQNTLLIGLDSHLSTEKVQYHLEVHMNFDLANEYRNCSEACDEPEFHKWVEKVKKLDEKRSTRLATTRNVSNNPSAD